MRITGVGDCGVDRYLDLESDRPGGITLNFAVNAKACFAPTDRVGVVTALGSDPESRIVLDAIEHFGLESCITRLEGRTSIQYIDRQPSGEKMFVRYEQGVLGDCRIGARERAVLAESDVVMAVVYEQILAFFDSVMEVPSSGLRAVDFGDLAGFERPLELVETYVDRFHVGFFGLTRAQDGLIDALERLARRKKRVFIVTLGAEGSLALGSEERVVCPALPVPEVNDTTGAGDTYAAGFLSEYCDSKNVARSLRQGAERAAVSVQRLGAFDAEPVPWSHRKDWQGAEKATRTPAREEAKRPNEE